MIELIHHIITGTFWIWPTTDIWAGVFGIVFFLTMVITEKYYALYNGFNRFPLYNLVVLVFSILLFLVLIFLFAAGAGVAEVNKVLLIYIAVQLIQTVFLVVFFKQKKIGQLTIADTAGVQKKFFTYSVYAFLANALFFLVTRVDFWILNYFKGETELGIYALSSRIGQMFLVFPALFAGVVLPSITAKKISADKLQSMFRILNSLNLVSMFILALGASWLIPFMFGEEFTASVMPLVLLLPGIFFLSAQTLLAAYFAGIGKPAINLYSTMISLAIVLILDFSLIPGYGAKGASVASTIAYAAGCLYTYATYIGKENYTWAQLLMNRADKEVLTRMLRQALGEK
jgi:O-antigen/teichoic acid export membrane protein